MKKLFCLLLSILIIMLSFPIEIFADQLQQIHSQIDEEEYVDNYVDDYEEITKKI